MGWLPIFKRSPAGNTRNATTGRARQGSAAATADTVQQARTRARRRLIGAAVLVVAGVIGFPLLFETQPRPVPVDIPIEIPRKDGSPALPLPTARPQAAAPASTPPEIVESSQDAGREVPPPVVKPAPTIVAARPASAATRPAPTPTPRVADADRAAALLDGKPVAKVEPAPARAATPPASTASGAARFIVQAGAFVDAAAARDTRSKLEHLGLKTYTQVADTPQGPRVRVRLGPFANRADADKALAKAKAAGVAALVITL